MSLKHLGPLVLEGYVIFSDDGKHRVIASFNERRDAIIVFRAINYYDRLVSALKNLMWRFQPEDPQDDYQEFSPDIIDAFDVINEIEGK